MKTLFILCACLVSASSFAQVFNPCSVPSAKSAALSTQRIITGVATQNGIEAGSFAANVTGCVPNVNKVLTTGFGNSMMRAPICGSSYTFANEGAMKQFASVIAANSRAASVCLSLHTSFPRR